MGAGPGCKGDFYLSGLPKDSSGCEAGSYLPWVETSLSAFLFGGNDEKIKP